MTQSFFPASIFRAILLASSLAIVGCDKILDEGASRAAERAEKKAGEGDFQGAVLLYEKALDGTERTAEIHYKLGVIYDDKLSDVVSAIHHFHRYLALAPKGAHAKDVNSLLKQDELKLVTVMNQGGTMTQKDAANLKNENLNLLKKITELRDQLKYANQQLQQQLQAQRTLAKASGKPIEIQQQKPIPPGARTYVVGSGDTLASISRKFYKGPGRWKDIQDANFNMLEGTAKLKPGMTLIIP
jgi:LysM repeat protein